VRGVPVSTKIRLAAGVVVTEIEARATNVGEEFYLGELGVRAAAPGDVELRVYHDGGIMTALLSCEAARILGMRLVSEGAVGMKRKYGPLEAVRRILSGQSTVIQPGTGDHYAPTKEADNA
jgi:hypothetical protein